MTQVPNSHPRGTSLAIAHPALAQEWHPTKNGDLTASDVASATRLKAWWLCSQGHEWSATCANRSRGQTGCPYCSGLRPIPGETDLATTHPDLVEEWHPTRNGDLTPDTVKAGLNKKVWWLGRDCGHEWESAPNTRTQLLQGCPYCSGRRAIPGQTDLATTRPDLAAEWHPTKNGDLNPVNVKANTNTKVWWRGRACGHEWQASPNRRTNMGTGCPFCANQAILVGFNDLASTQPHLAAQWHPTKNGDLTTRDVVPGSKMPAWWLGPCGHDWEASIASRVGGRGCPFCANKAVLAGFNDLATTHPEVAAQWHPTKNDQLGPSDVVAGSRRDVWWQCTVDPDHEWRTKPFERTGTHRTGCPECVADSWSSRGEDEVAEFVTSLGFTLRRGARLEDGSRFNYDIRIDSTRTLIEYNGIYYHCESDQRPPTHLATKYEHAAANGWALLTVWEDDWKERPQVVKQMLAHKLGASALPRVPARKAEVVTPSLNEARVFLEDHHIQGFAAGSIRLGLRYQGRLCAVLIARRTGDQAEILRYATAAVVPGGFGRLLAALVTVLSDYPQVRSVKTFSDNTISDGGLYERLGFRRGADLPPDYTYAGTPTGWKRVHKFNYRIARFQRDPSLTWAPGTTEAELARLNRLERVWDAGKVCWVLSLP